MLSKLKNLRTTVKEQESGAAMIFALLLLMMMLLLTVTVTVTATTQAESTRTLVVREANVTAANVGIEQVLMEANNSTNVQVLENMRGVGNAKTSDVTNVNNITNLKYRTYTERVVTAGNNISYYVYSTGYNTAEGVNEGSTVRATVEGMEVSHGAYIGDTVEYFSTEKGSFKYGILGLSKVTFEGTSKVFSYNSARDGKTPTGTSKDGVTVSSNQAVQITNKEHNIPAVILGYNKTGVACAPTALCSEANISTTYRNFNVSLKNVTDKVKTACPNSSYTIWKASENGGILNLPTTPGTGTCLSEIIFDVDTTVPASYTATAPQTLYLKGNITVNNNVKVNQTNTPTALQIFSSGEGTGLTVGDNAKINTVVGGPNACVLKPKSVTFGNVSCNTVTLQNESNMFIDLAAKGHATESVKNIWAKVFIEQL